MEDYPDYHSNEERYEAQDMMAAKDEQELNRREMEGILGELGIKWNKGIDHKQEKKLQYLGQKELENQLDDLVSYLRTLEQPIWRWDRVVNARFDLDYSFHLAYATSDLHTRIYREGKVSQKIHEFLFWIGITLGKFDISKANFNRSVNRLELKQLKAESWYEYLSGRRKIGGGPVW